MPSIFPESPDYDDKNGAQGGAKKQATHDNEFELTMGGGDIALTSVERLRMKALQTAENAVRATPKGERADRWLKLLRAEFGDAVETLTSLPSNDEGAQFRAEWHTGNFHGQPTARLKLWFGEAAAPKLEKGSKAAVIHVSNTEALFFDGTDLATSANYKRVVPDFHETFTQLAMGGPEALKAWAQRASKQRLDIHLARKPVPVVPARKSGAPTLSA